MVQNYGWKPTDSETVHDGANDPGQVIPAGFVRQTAWSALAQIPPEARPPDLYGVYVAPAGSWNSVVWRWADTWRRESIQRIVTVGGFPAYRFELTQDDEASPGTAGDHPRAELDSVDPEEKRRDRAAPAGFLVDGQEYWATFAVYLPADFPTDHLWATLFQRKLDDRFFQTGFLTWLTINVHQDKVDATVPGKPNYDTPDVALCDLADLVGRWAQFVIHEKLSSSGDGAADVTLTIPGKNPISVSLANSAATFPADTAAADVKAQIQYGYYRANEPAPGANSGPGTGIAYYTPLMISADGTNPPELP